MSDIINLAAALRDILSKETAELSVAIASSRINNSLGTYFAMRKNLIELVNLPEEYLRLIDKSDEYILNNHRLKPVGLSQRLKVGIRATRRVHPSVLKSSFGSAAKWCSR